MKRKSKIPKKTNTPQTYGCYFIVCQTDVEFYCVRPSACLHLFSIVVFFLRKVILLLICLLFLSLLPPRSFVLLFCCCFMRGCVWVCCSCSCCFTSYFWLPYCCCFYCYFIVHGGESMSMSMCVCLNFLVFSSFI